MPGIRQCILLSSQAIGRRAGRRVKVASPHRRSRVLFGLCRVPFILPARAICLQQKPHHDVLIVVSETAAKDIDAARMF